MPSIACLKSAAGNDWAYHFVLVRPKNLIRQEPAAVSQAEKDLEAAFQKKQDSGSELAVGEYLRDQGYVSVTGFKIAASKLPKPS